MPTLTILFSKVPDILAIAIREKRKKRHLIQKGRNEIISVCSDMIL